MPGAEELFDSRQIGIGGCQFCGSFGEILSQERHLDLIASQRFAAYKGRRLCGSILVPTPPGAGGDSDADPSGGRRLDTAAAEGTPQPTCASVPSPSGGLIFGRVDMTRANSSPPYRARTSVVRI